MVMCLMATSYFISSRMKDNKQPERSDYHLHHPPAPPMPDPIARAEQGTSGDLFGHLGLKLRRDAIWSNKHQKNVS